MSKDFDRLLQRQTSGIVAKPGVDFPMYYHLLVIVPGQGGYQRSGPPFLAIFLNGTR